MPTVFVSHSSEDAGFVEEHVVPLLESRGIDVWYSAESIQTSEDWERAIKRGLEAGDWFLVVLSPRSAKSTWVRRETGWAFANREGRIIPLLMEACDPNDLHIGLRGLQFVDFRGDRQKGAARLLSCFGAADSGGSGVPAASAVTPASGSPRQGSADPSAVTETVIGDVQLATGATRPFVSFEYDMMRYTAYPLEESADLIAGCQELDSQAPWTSVESLEFIPLNDDERKVAAGCRLCGVNASDGQYYCAYRKANVVLESGSKWTGIYVYVGSQSVRGPNGEYYAFFNRVKGFSAR